MYGFSDGEEDKGQVINTEVQKINREGRSNPRRMTRWIILLCSIRLIANRDFETTRILLRKPASERLLGKAVRCSKWRWMIDCNGGSICSRVRGTGRTLLARWMSPRTGPQCNITAAHLHSCKYGGTETTTHSSVHPELFGS